MDTRAEPIVVEQFFEKQVQQVWEAITEQKQMVQWFFKNIPAFEAKVGFETEFEVDAESRIYRHLWKILEADAPHRIVYHWSYRDIDGEGNVAFELMEEGSGTLLRLTNTGLDSFPDNMPEFTRESCVGGWEFFLKDNLKKYLDSSETTKGY